MTEAAGCDWTIRPGGPEDAADIARLFYQTIHEINSRDYSAEQIVAWAPENMDLDRWRESLTGKSVFVAEAAGRILGFAELEPSGHIDRFYCHSEYQGIGIGSGLLEQLVEEAVAAGISRLFAEASITARPFFERHGFAVELEQQVEIRGELLTNFVMKKKLGPDGRS